MKLSSWYWLMTHDQNSEEIKSLFELCLTKFYFQMTLKNVFLSNFKLKFY